MRFVIALALIVGASTGLSAEPAPRADYRCTSAKPATGAAWLQMVHRRKKVDGVFYAQTKCPANYRPVSGGVRYEGVWNEPSYANQWQQVASLPYDETEQQEAVEWRCMVIAKDRKTRPDPLWCTAVCCRWD